MNKNKKFENMNDGSVKISLNQNKEGFIDYQDSLRPEIYEKNWYCYEASHGIDKWYIVTNTSSEYGHRLEHLHRVILGLGPDDPDVDHIDRNPLNNRRSNLRDGGGSGNARNNGIRTDNPSGYKNVGYYSCIAKGKKYEYWRAQIRCKKVSKLFPFTDDGKEKAAIWVDAALVEHFGEFAVTNKSLGLI